MGFWLHHPPLGGLGCGPLQTLAKPHPLGQHPQALSHAGPRQRMLRHKGWAIPGRPLRMLGVPSGPPPTPADPGEPGPGRLVFGTPSSSCPSSRVSSFQAGWENPAPLPSSCSQQKTLAGPLIPLFPWDRWLPAACLPSLGKLLPAPQVPGSLKPEAPSICPTQGWLPPCHRSVTVSP